LGGKFGGEISAGFSFLFFQKKEKKRKCHVRKGW